MADLKRCDRCKDIFEPESSKDILLENGRKRSAYPRLLQLARYTDFLRSGGNNSFYDLCPECAFKLSKFLHNIDEDGSES